MMLALWASGVHAAPVFQCEPDLSANAPIVAANSFKTSPQPHAVDPAVERCAWGVGLAVLPGHTGTAFILVHPREIITNLHVVDPECSGNARFEFRHAFSRGHARSATGATVVARGNFCRTRKAGHFDYGGDWAIAVLERDPSIMEPMSVEAGARPLEIRTGDLRALQRDNGHFFLVGYGMQFQRGVVPYLSPGCALDQLFSADVVKHDCNAGHRSSGAPILHAETGGACALVAMHLGSLTDAPGQPAYSSNGNANVAVLAGRFAAAARAVGDGLSSGHNTARIIKDLAVRPAE